MTDMPAQFSSRIYMDNSATSFPKPPAVTQAMVDYAQRIGASAGRGAYREARASAAVIASCRARLNTLFNGVDPNHFVFTLNCTDALNLAIQGLVRPGDHVITTWMDHNSILRPLNALVAQGIISQTRVPVDPVTTVVDPDAIRRAITPQTRLLAVVHGSNVTGSLQPIHALGQIARAAGITYLVDAAQSAGHIPIDVQADQIDLLAFPGHKGLMGPLGTGALYIRPGMEKILRPIRFGGTGSVSEQDLQPDFMPDKYEAGSHNAIGLAGWDAGLGWILDKGMAALHEHDRLLVKTFLGMVEGLDTLHYYGPQGVKDRMGVFSVRIDGVDPLTLAQRLENEFGILTRPGLHCAPLAHQTIGTLIENHPPYGTTRLSFGPMLSPQDVQYAAHALATIALEKPKR
jgi:cysteine desulfurase/selenocysteine lyase